MLCICGVCIPVNALWPLVLFLFKPIWNYLQAWYTGKPAEKSTPPIGMVCEGGVCCMPGKTQKPKDLIKDGNNLVNIMVADDAILFPDVQNAVNGSLVRFTASWCKPCKKIEPDFKALAKEYPEIVFASVDVDELAEIAADSGVTALPAFHFYRSGELLGHTMGSNVEAIQDLLIQYAVPNGDKPKSD